MHHTAMVDKDLVAASSIPLILGVLKEGDSYGYAIIQRVRDVSDGRMNWTDSMIYPLLKRLESRGFIRSYWQTAETGRKRKYYGLEKPGQAELLRQLNNWEMAQLALSRLNGASRSNA
jgi:DNA-binding PadR family transcriptional regulator